MTSLCFDRPVGAAADLAELEYISALHQTSPDLRTDGSISAADISLFLKSRFGIEISEADVRDVILRNGLSCGGGSYRSSESSGSDANHVPTLSTAFGGKKGSESTDEDVNPGGVKGSTDVNESDHQLSSHDPRTPSSSVKRSSDTAPTADLDPDGNIRSDYLDLTEVVAALLIPELIRSANSDTSGDNYLNPLGKERSSSEFDSDGDFQAYLERRKQLEADVVPPPDIIGTVLDTLVEMTGLADDSDSDPIEVNEETVRAILRSLGDHVLADNASLVRQMVQAAQPNPDALDVEEGRGGDAPVLLDAKTFARALLSDVAPLYRLDDDVSPHAVFRDVFGKDKVDPGCLGIALCCRKHKEDALRLAGDGGYVEEEPKDLVMRAETEEASVPETPMDNEGGLTEPKPSFVGADDLSGNKPDNDVVDKARPTFNAPAIDYSSDTYATQTIGVGLWIFLLLHVLAAGTLGLQDFPSFVPSDIESCPDTPHLGCDVLESFLKWVDTIFTLVVIGGIVIMGIGAMGNRVGETSRLMVIISMLPAVYFFIKPFFSFGTAPSDLKGDPHRQFALGTSMFCALVLICSRLRQLMYMSFPKIAKSSALTRILSWGFAGGSEVERKQAASHKMNRLMANASSIAHDTDFIDTSSRSTKVSRSLTHFYENKEEKEKTGGYLWTYRSVRSRDLYRKEGVLFSGRILAANIMQYAIIVYIILFVLKTVSSAMENYENSWFIGIVGTGEQLAKAFLSRLETVPASLAIIAQKGIDLIYSTVLPAIESVQLDSCQTLFSKANYTDLLALCNSSADPSDFDLDADAVANLCANQNSLQALQTFCTKSTGFYSDMMEEANSFKLLLELSATEKTDGLNDFLQSIISSGFSMMEDAVTVLDPIEPWMVQMAFGLGGLIAFFMSIFLATLYIPSVTSSVLRFRSGVIPSLRDPHFSDKYRTSNYLVTYLTGAMFWGSLIYCAGVAFIIAFIVLALCWIITIAPQLAGESVNRIWGVIIGFLVTFITQWVLFASCAKAVKLIAFYRKRPAAANVYNLLWEASWVGTSVMFVAVRALKLIIAAALQVGRVDVPFLAEGAGQIGPLHLDRMPMIFRTDLLQHEAHRHPYIERLGKMYLMKIRHGNRFVNAAGSTWRVVFVLAFMPWLRQYRYMARYGNDWKAKTKLANRRSILSLKNSEHDGKDCKAGKVFQTAQSVAAELVDELIEC